MANRTGETRGARRGVAPGKLEACTIMGKRRGVTLVEVLLVLVVLTLVAATAWPALDRSFADQRLRDAADLVRAEWASARAEAMRSGKAQQFHYSLEEQTYWLDSCESENGSTGSSSQLVNLPAGGDGSDRHLTLPDEIYFHEGETQTESSTGASSEQTSSLDENGSDMIVNGEEGAAIVFYPNGSCTSARLVLRNEYDRGITLTIRDITGMSNVGEIFYVEDHTP